MMAIDVVGFLVDRKFPIARSLRAAGPIGRRTDGDRRLEILQKADAYRGQLLVMPKDDLNALYQEEVRKKAEGEARSALQEEEARFFNQASALADYSYWTKAAYWSLDEAVALALGKNPEIVNASKLAPYRIISPFVQRYERLKNLAVRAKGVGKLFDPVYPSIFVNWALENEIEIPEAMRTGVFRDGSGASWESISKSQSELVEKLKEIIEVQKARIVNFETTVASLRKKLPEAAETKGVPEKALKPHSSIERDNMLKVILSMAMDVYGHEPSKARSTATKDIRDALNKIGLDLSDDTIRRFIKAAEDQLPDWKEDSA